MTSEEIQKTIELLEKARHIGIILSDTPTHDAYAAAEVLTRVLHSRDIHVGTISRIEPPPPHQLTALTKTTLLPKEFIVSLNGTASPISHVRYEKIEDEVAIIFSPNRTAIQKDSLSFREGKIQCDVALVIGIPDIEKITSTYAGPDFFTQTPLVTLDISPNHTTFGEVNLVDPTYTSISEIVYHLVTLLSKTLLGPDEATLLLAGIFSQTRNLSTTTTSANTLLAASELLRLGAVLADAREFGNTAVPLSLHQLIGRATIRSRIDESQGIAWSFLTPEDFEKTGSFAPCVSAVIEHIEHYFPSHRLGVLLWQETQATPVRVTLSGTHTILETLARDGVGQFQSPSLLLTMSFETFKEAEENVRLILSRF